MNRETRNALQALVTDLCSLAAALRDEVKPETLERLCESCERVHRALGQECSESDCMEGS